MPRIKCSVLDRPREKALNRTATRGVVKFFNVCNQEQKEIETKITIAGSSERKREKVLSSIDKGSFLDRLKENDEINEDLDTSSIKDQNKPKWNVLRDDFIMGAKMKDWDKNGSNDDDDEHDNDDESEEDHGNTRPNIKNKKLKFKK